MDFGTLLVPAALLLAAPDDLGTYQRGLFCETPAFVVEVVEHADRGSDPARAVADINRSVEHNACRYSFQADVRARTVKFERNVAANHTVYSIYRVEVTAFAPEHTEIGNLIWKLSSPVPMYTLRAATPEHLYEH